MMLEGFLLKWAYWNNILIHFNDNWVWLYDGTFANSKLLYIYFVIVEFILEVGWGHW